MNATIESVAPLMAITVVKNMPRDSNKMPTKQTRMGADFATKLSVIANAMTQEKRREVSIAEAAELSLGEELERQYAKALDQLAKLKKRKPDTK